MGETADEDRARKASLDKALKAMFGRLQARPTPERLMSVVDQLDEADVPSVRRKAV